MSNYTPPSGGSLSQLVTGHYGAPAGSAVNQVLGSGPTVAKTRNVSFRMPSGTARRRSARRLDSGWERGRRGDATAAADWTMASSADLAPASSSWDRLGVCDNDKKSPFASAKVLEASVEKSSWRTPPRADASPLSSYASAKRHLQHELLATWDPIVITDRTSRTPWKRALLPGLVYDPPLTIIGGQPLVPGYTPPLGTALNATLASGYVPPLGDRVGNIEVDDPPPYVVYRKDPVPHRLPWGRADLVDDVMRIRWGHGPQMGPRDPPPIDVPSGSISEPPPIPPSQQVYIVMNDVQVVLLPDRTPIEVESLTLDTSVDTWCWSARMELADPDQRALLKPTADGPKVVEITINGYVWTIAVEGRDGTRAHPKEGGRAASVSGRSQTTLLSDSYTAKRSIVATDARSAQQLADMEITDRQLPFTIEWDGLDWIVPGGAFSYQDMAPIDVICQIAAARGAVVQSSPGESTLTVRSRYPTSPWTWSSDTADIALISDWITSESAQEQNKPVYDAVFVSGQQQGVSARVTREAEAGETWASQVNDSLIVTPDVAAERGRVVLSDRGMQDLIQVEIPLFAPGAVTAGSTGLYVPLMLVDVRDPDDPYQALSVAVSITARRGSDDDKALEVLQTVSLERHLSDAH